MVADDKIDYAAEDRAKVSLTYNLKP